MNRLRNLSRRRRPVLIGALAFAAGLLACESDTAGPSNIGQLVLVIIPPSEPAGKETLVHEAAHTSLDSAHASAAGWLAAQSADPTFISTYARDFPAREDIAETFVLYLAVRYRSDRIS